MFGVFARDRFRKNLRHVCAKAGGAHEENHGWPKRRSGELHGASDQPVGDENDSGLHRNRKERREAVDRREASCRRRLLPRADDYWGSGSPCAAGAGGSVWPGAGGDQGEKLRPGAGNCEQYGVWIDRRGVLEESGKNQKGRRDVSRRKPVSKSEVHRRDGRRAPLWRIQYVRNGFKSGRERLFATFHARQVYRRKSELRKFCGAGVGALRYPLHNAKNGIAQDEYTER